MLYVDVKYAALVGGRIKNFKQKGQYLWQYTCPHCSDWNSEKPKARAYIYRKKTDLFTKCHHCGHGSNVGNLVKHFDDGLYKQYVLERYQNNVSKFSDHKDVSVVLPPSSRTLPVEEVVDDILSPLKRIDTMGDHPARKYVLSRGFRPEDEKLFYYAPKFKKFVNSIVKKFTNVEENEHPRLIIPYFDRHGRVVHFNARAFDDREPKYMMVRIDEDAESIYGLERVDYSKTIYATEGEFDSLMVDNGIATGGASKFMSAPMEKMKSRVILIHDNEPRSKEVTKIVAKTIQEGYNCFLPPESFPFKDLNEAIQKGMSRTELMDTIRANSFQGLKAELRFSQWKKC